MTPPNGLNGSDREFSLKDGAFYALILATAIYFTAFFPTLQLADIRLDLAKNIYISAQFFLSSFFTNFLAITGLSRLLKSK